MCFTVTRVFTNVTAFAPFPVQCDKCYRQFLLLRSCLCFCILFSAWCERLRASAALKDNAQGETPSEGSFLHPAL